MCPPPPARGWAFLPPSWESGSGKPGHSGVQELGTVTQHVGRGQPARPEFPSLPPAVADGPLCPLQGGVKVLITGPWQEASNNYSCLFDQISVPASLIQPGVLRCYCPGEGAGHPPRVRRGDQECRTKAQPGSHLAQVTSVL